MSTDTVSTIVTRILDDAGVEYRIKMHNEQALTATEAARQRGVRLSQIVKAMLVRTQPGAFNAALIPDEQRLHLKQLARVLY